MKSKTRPSYVCCIRKEGRLSYCGRDTGFDFVFQSPEHARLNEEQGGRLVTCPECKKAAGI